MHSKGKEKKKGEAKGRKQRKQVRGRKNTENQE